METLIPVPSYFYYRKTLKVTVAKKQIGFWD